MRGRVFTLLLAVVVCLVLSFFEVRAEWTYTVRRGDTLFRIARRYGTTVAAIRRRNGLRGATIRIGQRIVIPTGRQAARPGGWYYTVRRGDTLFRIARRTGTNLTRLRAANGWIVNLRIGQRIFIPTGQAAAASRPAQGRRAAVNAHQLAQLIHAEAEAEPYAGKVAVGAVVLNRLQNTRFPNTLGGILYQPHAFEAVTNGRVYNNPNADSRRAAQAAINGWDPSGGAIYFFNPAKTNNRFIWSRRIINRIGKHVFAI